jgi:hypothetical protein
MRTVREKSPLGTHAQVISYINMYDYIHEYCVSRESIAKDYVRNMHTFLLFSFKHALVLNSMPGVLLCECTNASCVVCTYLHFCTPCVLSKLRQLSMSSLCSCVMCVLIMYTTYVHVSREFVLSLGLIRKAWTAHKYVMYVLHVRLSLLFTNVVVHVMHVCTHVMLRKELFQIEIVLHSPRV